MVGGTATPPSLPITVGRNNRMSWNEYKGTYKGVNHVHARKCRAAFSAQSDTIPHAPKRAM